MVSNSRKNLIYSLVLLVLIGAVYLYRNREVSQIDGQNNSPLAGWVNLSGQTMGTSYQIKFKTNRNEDFQSGVDSIFSRVTNAFSSYEVNSEVNRFNLDDSLASPSPDFKDMLAFAKDLNTQTLGAFEPTQKPLENLWGFSRTGPYQKDSIELMYVMPSVGIQKLMVSDSIIQKSNPGTLLDFNPSALGWAIDEVATYLEKLGIADYWIQIGGQIRANGQNERGELWKAGIRYPDLSTGEAKEGVLALENKTISPAGNWEDFYVRDSTRISFTLDPRTGMPVRHGLLAAWAITADSKKADALAEVLLILGTREAIKMDSLDTELEMILIHNEKGSSLKIYASPEIQPFLSFPIQ
ncbi:FAD:protein FMN transferase [Algoriphagus confluentis]|uniref:FAD:protein FMN transferase n=1 Tax=Algoriphagus confluentis TaxID=1697556 RepID=A0ABQ6PMB1_9BACT|nr:FAD:protein FMN transferase [Algoriphagus confluentis]